MDNPTFQSDEIFLTRQPKRLLMRANSTLTPTYKTWHLTQAARPKLCRCNSFLVSKHCCPEDTEHNLDEPVSLEYSFFAKNTPSKNIMSKHSSCVKDLLMDSYSRLHNCSPVLNKYTLDKSAVSTIYDPQFLSSRFSYSDSHHSASNEKVKKEWWSGAWRWNIVDRKNITTTQKVAAILCALVMTLLASGNIVYTFQTVEKPLENLNKGIWIDVVLISGEFRITNEYYRSSFANHTSEDFQQFSSIITHQLDSLFSLSVISEPYHSTSVTELLPGLLVRCQIVLQATTHLTATKVGLAFIGGLQNQHSHMWLGNFSVDIQSIGFQATNDAVSWTGWSQWSKCQYLEELGHVQVRSRNCTLQSGQYLYSTLPCLLLPHSHSNIETAPCLPYDQLRILKPNFNTTRNRDLAGNNGEKVISENYNSEKNSVLEREITPSNVSYSKQQQTKRDSGLLCACGREQVCIFLQNDIAPQCLPVLDLTDPTGCGGHCKLNSQLCQRIKNDTFRCVEDTKCLDDEWQCGNKLCIPQSKRCDGHFNCYDHTDEYNCDCLGREQFTCNDSQCIPNRRFCDGFPDCNDHSDEPFGCGGECKKHEWKCSNTRCIAQNKHCNGDDDCGDASDEADCYSTEPE